MALSRDELSRLLTDLDAATPAIRDANDDEALACMGEDIANQAGSERCWVEDQVEQVLWRHSLIGNVAERSGEEGF